MIELHKTVTRNTLAPYRNKTLIVRLTTNGVLVKLSGQRWARAVLAPYDAVYEMGCKLMTRETPSKPRKVRRGLLRS